MRKILIFVMCLFVLVGCASNDETAFKSRKEMDGKVIGVLAGSIYDKPVRRIYQDSKFKEYNSDDEMLTALLNKDIDGFVTERPSAIIYASNNEGITFINESIVPGDMGFVFSNKKQDLLKQFNDFIAESKENGYLDYLDKKWIIPNGINQHNDSYRLTGENGTINTVTSINSAPFSFENDGEISGYDVDILIKFCYENGYYLNIDNKSFSEIIESVKNDTYDIGFASINITNERKKEVAMSDVICDNYGVFVVRKAVIDKVSEFETLSQLDGHTIGILNGSIYEDSVRKAFNNIQINNYPSRSDAIDALMKKEIDGYIIEEPFAMNIENEYPELTYVHEPVDYIQYAYVFSSEKEDVKQQFNEFIVSAKSNGYLEYLNNKWFTGSGNNYRNNEYNFTGENGKLIAATSSDSVPYSFSVDGEFHGYEVELFEQFCYEYGYECAIVNETFNKSLQSVSNGSYDVTFNSIGMTQERLKKYSMSNPVYSCPGVIVTRCK